MNKVSRVPMLFLAMLMVLAAGARDASAVRGGSGGRGDGPVIYVTSQGLYYDSIVTADPLPMKGRFQELRDEDGRLETKYGPGDRGYRGGRWWIDLNGNRQMDEGDKFFSCPLLGPGRTSP